jgi:hypothetical protein
VYLRSSGPAARGLRTTVWGLAAIWAGLCGVGLAWFILAGAKAVAQEAAAAGAVTCAAVMEGYMIARAVHGITRA